MPYAHTAADEAASARGVSSGEFAGPSVGDDDVSLAKAAGDICTTIFHPSDPKMGKTAILAVVDESLRFMHGRTSGGRCS